MATVSLTAPEHSACLCLLALLLKFGWLVFVHRIWSYRDGQLNLAERLEAAGCFGQNWFSVISVCLFFQAKRTISRNVRRLKKKIFKNWYTWILEKVYIEPSIQAWYHTSGSTRTLFTLVSPDHSNMVSIGTDNNVAYQISASLVNMSCVHSSGETIIKAVYKTSLANS